MNTDEFEKSAEQHNDEAQSAMGFFKAVWYGFVVVAIVLVFVWSLRGGISDIWPAS